MTVTSNNTYDIAGNGYRYVNVNVPSSSYSSGSKTFTSNGTYYASSYGYDGFSSVTVNVSSGGGTKRNVSVLANRSTESSCTMSNKSYIIMSSVVASSTTNAFNAIAGTNGLHCSAGNITWYPYSKYQVNADGQSPWYPLNGYINVGSNTNTTFTKHSTATTLWYIIIGLDTTIAEPHYVLKTTSAFYNVTVSYGSSPTATGWGTDKGVFYKSSLSASPSFLTTTEPSGGATNWNKNTFTLPYNSSYNWLFLCSMRPYDDGTNSRYSFPLDTFNMMQKSSTASTYNTSYGTDYININNFTMENLVFHQYSPGNDATGLTAYAGLIHQTASITAGLSSRNGVGLTMWIAVNK